MFKDDRMISILSGIVLMLAIGTLVQRGDLVTDFIGGEPEPLELVDDTAVVEPDRLTRVDVLRNDMGISHEDGQRLTILTQPGCGRAYVQDGAIQISGDHDCAPDQRLTYGLVGSEELRPGTVEITVRGATGTRRTPVRTPSPTEAIALAPQPSLGVDTSGRDVVNSGSSRSAAPQITPQRPGAQSRPYLGTQSPSVGGSAAAPSAPAVPGVAAPSAPAGGQIAGLPSLGAPQQPTPGGGAAQAPAPAPTPSTGTGVSGGNTAASSRGTELAANRAPSAPSAIGSAAPSLGSPSLGSPSLGNPSLGSPSLGETAGLSTGLSQPSLRPPSSPSAGIGSPSAPSAPSLSAPSAPQIAGVGSAPAAPAAPGSTAPSIGVPRAPASPGGQLASGLEPTYPTAPGGLASVPQPSQPSDQVARIDGSSGSIGNATRGAGASPGSFGGEAVPTIALARVEAPTPSSAPRRRDLGAALSLSGADTGLAPMGPSIGAGIDASAGAAIALAEPSSGLGDIMSLRDNSIALALIDTSEPAPLAGLAEGTDTSGTEIAAIDPTGAPTSVPEAGAQQELGEVDDQGLEIAALPSAELACVVPPSITLDVKAAGETVLMINSPCHADSVAELTYNDLDFGVKIGRTGRGEILVLGFETSAEAKLEFADGETLEFGVPFTGVDRVERVALSWTDPVVFEVHAFEFNAEPGSEGHVHPGAPRSFREVRRRGGGYITEFQPIEGVGDHVQVYSHWIRRGGKSGVVKMYVDFASRHRDRLEGTCGDGELARPSFDVTRSTRGRFEGSDTRRLGAMDCDEIDKVDDHLIGAGVRDIIISQR